LLAAAAAGVLAIDTIYTDFRDSTGLKAEAVAARRSGFAGKMAIHPDQLAAINEVFSTSPEEREWAERGIAAFAAHPYAGTLALDGKMIDRPHLVLAHRLLGLPPACPRHRAYRDFDAAHTDRRGYAGRVADRAREFRPPVERCPLRRCPPPASTGGSLHGDE